ncbi:MAG: RICIN domain-containing protein [Woeseiaceae bacterium]
MISRCVAVTGLLLLSQASLAADDAAAGDFIRLVDALDEPEFYCLDLAGWGDHLQLDDPLQTHTCKNRRAGDQKFYFADGRLRVAGFDRCVQIAGSGGETLAGSAVIARTCSDNALQELSLDDDGRIRVGDSGLCLGAGSDSTEASGPSHMWRTLTAINCETAPSNLVSWQVGVD